MLTSLTVSRGLRVVDVDVNKSAVIDISGEATDGGHRNADGIGAHGKLPGARDRIALPLPLGAARLINEFKEVVAKAFCHPPNPK